ncbi:MULTISPECIES: DUF4306 domain-containing protein [Clostridia]|uniref:DUF4306 domain-containing protein n=1 Tax=Clostridia TaxID=186801 RepID=UPI000EA361E7|nr:MULTISPECIES: DUF4306 domain-containing protein [Clostridia]NBJ70271.1 DUF4306 domain-containing protein [Roseburia sp. 1XD42-34]RKI76720.1 DUF4306 domain-containing protein [Clostridium sp. 1xD42-85]
MKKIVTIFIILLIISVYTFFLSYWAGSYLMLEPDWQEKVVLTPDSVKDPRDIYFFDKWVFAFQAYPARTIIFLLSASAVVGFCVFFVRKFIRKRKNNQEI